MRRLATLTAVVAGLLLLLAVPALAGEVTLTDDGFEPDSVTVTPGTTVVWTNASSGTYTVVAEDGAWDSGPLEPGDTFSITLRREGTYAYTTEDGEHEGAVVVAAAVEDDDEAAAEEGAEEESAPAPVTPVTGLPVLVVLGAAGVLLVSGGLLVSRPGRR